VTKYLRKNNLKEERVILAHGFSPWLIVSIAFSIIARQKHDRRAWWRKGTYFFGGRGGERMGVKYILQR
jgi:hypothetical protein